ncbi:hypothetical protein BigBertha_60 [Bacillus phage BigBertha]|uniref:Uncharacterized protein n=7 Tax=Caudoviricetes TaxID=2731619 RepID=A0A7U3T8L9_9CAUD|nr:terminase small subunit [Bacillus phage Troll]YP_008771087.1 terminase small subunit [Bacillus phage BigBertha]YP_009055822.1 terminase small subunit [Bacillus phage Riley]YP_009206416.1 terminase small subunit [Bacillus phage AvesoBmore]YP_009289939.1 terminase small subunit [Bacillus phage Phrodo]AMW61492.1 hypothetical protein JUGLONE_59 [Bacillus phage Juglone]QDH49750.1 hypothetical protein BEYONPHE_63 [Bacillus phage Beyonphe]QPY77295.1 hypothetical protein ANTHOS_58 [Bacillus phage
MSMANNIKKGIKKKNSVFDSQEELRDTLNSAFSSSMKQFIKKLEMGEIPIDNIADAIRVLGAYKELNGIDEMMNGQQGAGMLPEINMRQEKVVDDMVRDGKMAADEEGKIDVSTMDMNDVADLIRNMDIAQNAENEGTF